MNFNWNNNNEVNGNNNGIFNFDILNKIAYVMGHSYIIYALLLMFLGKASLRMTCILVGVGLLLFLYEEIVVCIRKLLFY